MAFGSYTWFGGLFGHIPLFDRVRLQSRNLGIVDLALAVLLGFWVDRLLIGSEPSAAPWARRRGAAGSLPPRPWPPWCSASWVLAVPGPLRDGR